MRLATDYHLHTPRCKHALGSLAAYADRALALGLEEIGFADHNPLPRRLGNNVRMEEAEFPAYVADVQRLQDQHRGALTIRLGLELDYVEGLEDYLAAQVRAYPWDYVIGSVHYLDRDCLLPSWPAGYRGDVRALYQRYAQLVSALARTGFCDIIAHLDIPKRSGLPPIAADDRELEAALDVVAEAGLCLELNTSGYRHGELVTRETYPGFGLATAAITRGIPLVVNSDAHRPEHVGAEFARVAEFLRGEGARARLARFQGRRRTLAPVGG